MVVCGRTLFFNLRTIPISHIKQNNVQLVKTDIKKGIDINRLEVGWTALMFAAAFNAQDVLNYLLPLNENIEEKNKALFVAIRYDNIEIANLLIEKGADVNAKDDFGDPVIFSAVYPVRAKSVEIVKFLIEHGALVNAKMHSGELIKDFVYDPGLKKYFQDHGAK